MTRRRIRFLAILVGVIAVPLLAWAALMAQAEPEEFPFRLSDRLSWMEIEKGPDGGRILVFEQEEGDPVTYTPEEFLAALEVAQGDREQTTPLSVRRTLNITSWQTGMLWVALGLLGQVLFTGRMLVQWLTSEREGRSTVPVSFWWMSLGGATMLIIYFVWRVDIVGVLGQSTGWFIYIRNLWMIYGRPRVTG